MNSGEKVGITSLVVGVLGLAVALTPPGRWIWDHTFGTPPVVADSTCRDGLDIDNTVMPDTRYRVGDRVDVFGTDKWIGEDRQIWVFITGQDGNTFTYGEPSVRFLADDQIRHMWASWDAHIGAQGESTIKVRLLSRVDGDALAAQVRQTKSYLAAIPAGAEAVIDIPIARDC